MSQFRSFEQFIADTKSATMDEHLATMAKAAATRDVAWTEPLPKVSRRSFEAMRKHILSFYADVAPTRSFVAVDGQYVDCIPIDQQPSLRGKGNVEIADPPAPVGAEDADTSIGDANPAPMPSNATSSDVDEFGNERSCPQGHVPIRRITLEEMARFGTLSGFFKKRPPQLPGSAASGHCHAGARQIGTNYGGSCYINVWDPSPAAGCFSLSQCWYVAGAGDNLQTVEAGWQVYPTKYNTARPVLFIYWSTNNYKQGAYNLEDRKFVQTDFSWAIGIGLTAWSTAGGAQIDIQFQWQRDNSGNWWLFLKGAGALKPVGYYPRTLFGDGLLSNNSDRVDFGGEVWDGPRSPMGSGAFASAGWKFAAYQRQLRCLNASGSLVPPSGLTPFDTLPQYTVDLNGSAGAGGTPYFYFGGHP